MTKRADDLVLMIYLPADALGTDSVHQGNLCHDESQLSILHC